MKTFVPSLRTGLFALSFIILIAQVNAQTTTEFVFKNPVLVTGVADQDGAVYQFKNVAPGIDANVTVIGRSGPQVILDTIDIAPGGGMGYDKALQPQLGVHGTVPANSNWWMKFQVNFLVAGNGNNGNNGNGNGNGNNGGKNNAASIKNFVASAIDVDGDNVSIAENIKMFQTNGVTTSLSSVLTSPAALPVTCPKDGKPSLSIDCPNCLGQGYIVKSNGKLQNCSKCNNTGKLFAACNHPWIGSDILVSGTTFNALGIDTLAINNMATFSYSNTDQVTFTYGGTTGAATSSAGQRLNSLWFKSFDYSLSSLLPLQLLDFTAAAQKTGVDLKWTTAAEKDFSHFILERSTDGINFKECAVIFGNSNTSNNGNYSYKDQAIENTMTVVYYRLKMVDVSSHVSYSGVKIISLSQDKKATVLAAYPNPAKDQLHVAMPAAWYGKKGVAEIYNTAGIMIKNIQLMNINQTENLDVSLLTRGFYTVNIICLNTSLQTKILKN